jgi:hypothetical protein
MSDIPNDDPTYICEQNSTLVPSILTVKFHCIPSASLFYMNWALLLYAILYFRILRLLVLLKFHPINNNFAKLTSITLFETWLWLFCSIGKNQISCLIWDLVSMLFLDSLVGF